MKQRFFSMLSGNKSTVLSGTQLTIKYGFGMDQSINPKTFLSMNSNSTLQPCTTIESFENACDDILVESKIWQENKIWQKQSMKVNIEVSGQLNNKQMIDKKFFDFNLFEHFLKSNGLIFKTRPFDAKSELDTVTNIPEASQEEIQSYMSKFTQQELINLAEIVKSEIYERLTLTKVFENKIKEEFGKELNQELAVLIVERKVGNDEIRNELVKYVEISSFIQKLVKHAIPRLENANKKLQNENTSNLNASVKI